MNFCESLLQFRFKDWHFAFTAHLDLLFVNVENHKLNKTNFTSQLGFLSARTLVVGRPTNPAPKHETLNFPSINNFR